MKSFLELSALIFCSLLINGFVQGQRQGLLRPVQQRKPQPPAKVMCTADSLMIYQDCRMCVCPRPHRAAKCFRKSCDLRTKDSGQCPTTTMRLDDNKLCPGAASSACRTDNDCPDKLVCCFDFCKGNQCVSPVPLDPGLNVHRGRGFP